MNRNLIIGSVLVLLMGSGMRGSSILKSPIDPQDREQADEGRSVLHLTSPGEIERYVNDHNDEADLDSIWAGLGIVTDSPPGTCGCREDDCPGRCNAQAIPISSRGENPQYAIVRICYADEHICWFLLFKKEDRWRFMNSVVAQESRYEGVRHRIVSCRDKRWLAVAGDTGGTGVLASDEHWFGISDNGLLKVLSYPVSGHEVQGESDDYELKSKVPPEVLSDDCVVAVQYEILRDSEFSPKFRWTTSVKRRLQFAWDAGAEKFVLDKVNSNLRDDPRNPVLGYLSRHGYLN
ncbi:MAG TPA: hypothetical protein VLG74_17005 [Blastocatellia bacterium]|nr:hypothetical protein [Blastocatellia bacterium]